MLNVPCLPNLMQLLVPFEVVRIVRNHTYVGSSLFFYKITFLTRCRKQLASSLVSFKIIVHMVD